MLTPILSFADYALMPIPFTTGVIFSLLGLWLFYRSHRDLATNWSISLEIREDHSLITTGIYRSIRHPMYAAIFLQNIGQALIAANWIVGPFNLCAFGLLFSFRLVPEERMMLEHFGRDYEIYMKQSKRLIPLVW
jgi:protein-S-isoprenylcysteine O-methyltransferase Ste14